MNKISILLNLILLILSSCHTNKSKDSVITISKFPVEKELAAEVITIPPVAITPFNLFTTGDKLIMFNMKKDTIFDVFKLPECKYLFSAGVKGEGPNDFLDIDRRLFIPTTNGFKTFFQSKKELKEAKILDNSILIAKDNTLQFNIDQYPINGFTPINDTTYIYWSGFNSETEYNLLNRNRQETISFSPYPDWRKPEMDEDKMITYIKNTTVKPDGKMFASFYGYFKRLRIYDQHGSLQKDIQLKTDPYSDHIELNPADRTIYYFAYPKSSEKYIYVLCKNDKQSSETNPELQIWKWDGTPVASYKLDRPISLFSISEKYNKLYAVNGEFENEVYVYSFPKELLK